MLHAQQKSGKVCHELCNDAASAKKARSTNSWPAISWWSLQDLNLRPPPCEGDALPLSQATKLSTAVAADYYNTNFRGAGNPSRETFFALARRSRNLRNRKHALCELLEFCVCTPRTQRAHALARHIRVHARASLACRVYMPRPCAPFARSDCDPLRVQHPGRHQRHRPSRNPDVTRFCPLASILPFRAHASREHPYCAQRHHPNTQDRI